jgi:ATP-dependent Zn protease
MQILRIIVLISLVFLNVVVCQSSSAQNKPKLQTKHLNQTSKLRSALNKKSNALLSSQSTVNPQTKVLKQYLGAKNISSVRRLASNSKNKTLDKTINSKKPTSDFFIAFLSLFPLFFFIIISRSFFTTFYWYFQVLKDLTLDFPYL